jgi:cysteinyl-tRNA synthetase
MATIKLYNTLTKQKEEFKPIIEGEVKMYNCGPTVYSHQHIGNLYSAVFADVLRRMFEYLGYTVTQVMNITDVGHLVSTDDAGANDSEGEDKMEKGAKKAGITVWEVAKKFTDLYLSDLQKINILEPYARPRATEFINQMIEMIQELEKNGYTYTTVEAVYFDTSKFPEYGQLGGQKQEDKKEGVREDVFVDTNKRNPADFALWFNRVGRFADHTMHWPSPWGEGFPGWHIECSAMSKFYLGKHFDVHTGGVEHITVHHANEIAQSEGANHEKFVNYWLHHQLILVEGTKMSKSIGNVFTLSDLELKGYDPLALRLLYLQSKYREQLNFTLEALEASQIALNNIRKQIRDLVTKLHNEGIDIGTLKATKQENTYQNEFEQALADDLNTSVALSAFFKLLKDQSIDAKNKLEQLYSFDQVLGLKLREIKPFVESDELKSLKAEWQTAREQKDWTKADELRAIIQKLEE